MSKDRSPGNGAEDFKMLLVIEGRGMPAKVQIGDLGPCVSPQITARRSRNDF